MTTIEIVKKIVGNIHPAGETHIDHDRFDNLKAMCELAEGLLSEIQTVSYERNKPEHSVKEMGQYAHNFLKNIHGFL